MERMRRFKDPQYLFSTENLSRRWNKKTLSCVFSLLNGKFFFLISALRSLYLGRTKKKRTNKFLETFEARGAPSFRRCRLKGKHKAEMIYQAREQKKS
jgi:hypothetical protein